MEHPLAFNAAATSFFTNRDAQDGSPGADDSRKQALAAAGALQASDIVDELFRGLDDGRYYIVADDVSDVPTPLQIERRMREQMEFRRPRAPEFLGRKLQATDPAAFEARMRQAEARRKAGAKRMKSNL